MTKGDSLQPHTKQVSWYYGKKHRGPYKGVSHKLKNKYDGPYKVAKVLGNDRYRIKTVRRIKGYKRFSAVVVADFFRRYSSVSSDGKADSLKEIDDSDGGRVDRQVFIDLLESR